MENMEVEAYKKSHLLLVVIQTIFLTLCIGNTLFSLLSGNGLDNNVITISKYVLSLIMYGAILFYAFWGYKHSVIPFRVSIMSYLLLCMVDFIYNTSMPIGKGLKVSMGVIAVLILILLMTFECTFKKYKTIGLYTGYGIIIFELIRTIFVFIASGKMNYALGDLAAIQPLSRLISSIALVLTYASRCHWSKNGKIDFFEE